MKISTNKIREPFYTASLLMTSVKEERDIKYKVEIITTETFFYFLSSNDIIIIHSF